MTVLVDSNVLLDVMTGDPDWSAWSGDALAECAERSSLAINPLIHAEVSIRFDRIEDLEDALPEGDFIRLPLPREAAFLAGKCFVHYRRRRGTRTSSLSDFYIGLAPMRRSRVWPCSRGMRCITAPTSRGSSSSRPDVLTAVRPGSPTPTHAPSRSPLSLPPCRNGRSSPDCTACDLCAGSEQPEHASRGASRRGDSNGSPSTNLARAPRNRGPAPCHSLPGLGRAARWP